MRLKLGRPQLSDYHRYVDLAPAPDDAPVTITWAGVTTLLISDGSSAVLTDGFFSRPPLLTVGVGKISPVIPRIEQALARLNIEQLDAVIPVHTHFDHAMDSSVVAERTGAKLVGGSSVSLLGCSLPPDQVIVATDASPIPLGAFDITLIEGHHCPPDRYPGTITTPVIPPVRTSAYRCGEAWSMLVHHSASDRRALVVGSAGFIKGALAGQQADVAYLGIGQLGLQPESYIEDYWRETVRTVGARRVVLIHWDDFFRPLDQPLRALPYAGDDLDVSMRMLLRLAAEDGVTLHLPALWQRVDPWSQR